MPYSSDSRIAAIEKKRDTLISQSSSTGSGTSERFKRARMFPQNLSIRLSGQTIDADTLTKLQDNWNVWMTNSAFRQQADALIADPSKTAADLSYPATVSSPLPSIYTGSGVPFVTAQSLADALSPLQAEIDALEAQGATDAELNAAVASLASAINAKQDANTAATDAELASLSASITAALNLKQDSATAATDSELAAALATAASDATAKADAAKAFAVQRSNHTGTQSANTITGLATVATSGAYNDLSGKPTIPAAQVQADYTQASTGAVDFIKNKPTLGTAAAQNTSAFATAAQGAKADTAIQTATAPIVKTGTDIAISAATTSTAGSLSAADKAKLDKTRVRSFTATATKSNTNSTTETSVVPTGNGTLLVPTAVFDTPGYAFYFEAKGIYSNTATGLLTLKIKLGSQVTLQITSLSLPSLTSKPWYATGTGTVKAGRALVSHAMLNYEDATTKMDAVAFANSSITVAAGDKQADMTAQWNLALLGATFTVEDMFLEIIPAP